MLYVYFLLVVVNSVDCTEDSPVISNGMLNCTHSLVVFTLVLSLCPFVCQMRVL